MSFNTHPVWILTPKDGFSGRLFFQIKVLKIINFCNLVCEHV